MSHAIVKYEFDTIVTKYLCFIVLEIGFKKKLKLKLLDESRHL